MLIYQYNCQQLGPKINTDVEKEGQNIIMKMEANIMLKDVRHLGILFWAEDINL